MLGKNKFHERRKSQRFDTGIEALAKTSQGARHAIEISDLSEGGCAVVSERTPLKAGLAYGIKIKGLETLGSVAAWSEGQASGLAFENPLHVAVVDHLVGANPPEQPAD